jgi:hypothetical protein
MSYLRIVNAPQRRDYPVDPLEGMKKLTVPVIPAKAIFKPT